MKAVILRPLAIFTCTFFAISCYLFTADTAWRLWSAVFFSSLFLLCAVIRLFFKGFRKRTLRTCAVSAVCFLLAGGAAGSLYSYSSYSVRLSEETVLAGKQAEVLATVTDKVSSYGYYGVYNAHVHSGEDYREFNCRLTSYEALEAGYTVVMNATFELPSADGDFDERRYLLSNNITLTATSEEITVTNDKVEPTLKGGALKLSGSIRKTLFNSLGSESGGFVSALLLGNRSDIDKSLKRDFSRLGISHILAISGMHLTVICTLAAAVAGLISKRLKKPFCIATVIFYMLITGFGASVMRSGIMLLFMIAASLFKRDSDGITNLSASVLIICIADPYATADIALQLSFSAVMALLLMSSKRREIEVDSSDKKEKLKAVKDTLLFPIAATVVVVLFLLPLEWLYFGKISLISPVTSPVFTLLATVILWLSPFLVLLSASQTISAPIAFAIDKLVDETQTLSRTLSDLRGITVSIDTPLTPVFCVLIFAAVIGVCVCKRKRRLLAVAILTGLVLSFGLSCLIYRLPGANEVTVSMENHKSSDAFVIVSENKAMLIDIGNGYMPILRQAMSQAEREHATELEVLMLTHLHAALPSTLNKLLESYKVRSVLIPDDGTYNVETIVKVCKSNGTEAVVYEYGDTVSFGDVTVECPQPLFLSRSVQPIIKLTLTAFGEKFVYLGGGYSEAVPDADLTDADHLWLGSHGPLYKKDFAPTTSLACRIYASEAIEEFIIADEKRKPQRIKIGE